MLKEITYQCPSNIALVKYWGKKEGALQLPANASISWSLAHLFAKTTVSQEESDELEIEFYLDGQPKESFVPKIKQFLDRIIPLSPELNNRKYTIHSTNNFPHGAGIASSAAGFGALALCFAELEGKFESQTQPFYERASEFARLGSGSACRSVFSLPAIWGQHSAIPGSSDNYAVPFPFDIHENLQNWQDAVLIIDDGEKSVSSTQGHDLLKNHPYATARFGQATVNLERITSCFVLGDVDTFIQIVESEALQLHAMMMSSEPYYLLVRPNTLAAIEKIWAFRRQSNVSICFTLDAGANVHVLFPKSSEIQVKNFIESELLLYCKNRLYLCSDTNGLPIKS